VTRDDPLQNVLGRLAGVRKRGDGHDARCPAHDDQHASLSVALGDDGRVLLHCHAGCAPVAVCKAMGLRLGDLFPPGNNGDGHARIDATYDYRDASGELVFQVVRYEGKQFKQRRPDGNGEWSWKLGHTPRVLYRLPELLAAGPDEWVFVVEGEKDADRLASVGLIATCNPGGAKKWSKLSDDSALHGRRVVIIADKDAAGREHAADVAMRLRNRARELRVLELPGEGKDASDWFDAGGDVRRLLELIERAPAQSTRTTRPQIQANERQLRDVRADALAALTAANDPPRLFTRAGGVARVALVHSDQNDSMPVVQQLDADALRGELTDAADWLTLKHSKQGGDFLVPDLPPTAIARDILSLPAVDLPYLAGVIACPTFAPDGSLITANGYHASSELWLHSSITDLPPVSSTPDTSAITAAREALLEVIADFPFVDDASRANALALMLLPFVRPLIAGPTPLHAADAPSPATGKDLLVKSALWPALGYEVGATTSAKDPDEWRKKITSTLAGGSPAILWGNVARRPDSEHLAAVLTDVIWRDRQLGQTKELTLPNRAVWAATGNNLVFSRELARRVVWIRLDAKMETPEQRSGFRHPNLLGYVREHRARLVHAALTLVRAWLAAGRPAGTQVMGSFESYAAVMGGILDVAGVPGFLANGEELRRHADAETGEWRAFVTAWRERWGDAWVGVSDLASLLWSEDGRRSDLLMGIVTSERERGAVTQLGMRLSAKRECVIAGFRITVNHRADYAGRLQYRLVPVEAAESAQTFCRPFSKVCTKVCNDNSPTVQQLEAAHRPYIPFSHTQRVHAGAPARAHACEGDPAKRSVRSVPDSQPPLPPELARTDLATDLVQTLPLRPERSVRRVGAEPRVDWLRNASDDIPKVVVELAREHEGWTPCDWRNRLLQLAGRCEGTNPERAAELRRAAELMTRSAEKTDGE